MYMAYTFGIIYTDYIKYTIMNNKIHHQPTRSTQPCIPPRLLNRVPALADQGKGENITSARWHVSSGCKLLYSTYFTLLTYSIHHYHKVLTYLKVAVDNVVLV